MNSFLPPEARVSTGQPLETPHGTRLVSELEDRVDRLAMLCCAMWTVIQAHTNVEDEYLMRLVNELDLTDGHADGKAAHVQVSPCVKCQRPVALRQASCMYCGEPRKQKHPFEAVL